MNVLIACEFSAVVREAFSRRGHLAMSCDLRPSAKPGLHYQGDVRDLLYLGWDLLIAHPPCTHLAVSGAAHFEAKKADGRQQAAIDFFFLLAEAPIKKKCIEQPISIMSTRWRKPDQIIQPWYFGHPEFKATCFWLEGLSALEPTEVLCPPAKGTAAWAAWNYTHRLPPSPKREALRSMTKPGIARAMAEQWG